MKMKWIFTLALVVLGTLGVTTTAQAKSVSYSALKYGTNQSSIASKYFVKPAKVTVKKGRYQVTMHLKTGKALGKFPVQVLKVNGKRPQHVRKVRDKAGNSNIYYSFTAKNLKKKITAKLSINVLHVYKAKHNLSFKFKTSQLPSLKKKHTSRALTTSTTQAPAVKKAIALLLP